MSNDYLNPLEEKYTERTQKTFFEELQGMAYIDRCIVLGIVLGTAQSEILKTLSISPEEYRKKLHDEGGLYRWNLLRRLLHN